MASCAAGESEDEGALRSTSSSVGRQSDGPAAAPRSPSSEAVPWSSVAVAEDGRELTVSFEAGLERCVPLDEVRVDPRDDAVVVTVFVTRLVGVSCDDIGVSREATVVLDGPLSEETTFIDGA